MGAARIGVMGCDDCVNSSSAAENSTMMYSCAAVALKRGARILRKAQYTVLYRAVYTRSGSAASLAGTSLAWRCQSVSTPTSMYLLYDYNKLQSPMKPETQLHITAQSFLSRA